MAGDRCPRCGGGFHCGVADATPCPCSGVQLSPALLASLRSRYTRCLCLACLRTLAAAEQAQDAVPEPANGKA